MHLDLGLTDVSRASGGGGGCCGGACGGHGGAADGSESAANHGDQRAAEQRFAVVGMTCGHCVASVREELGALDGVESVDVALAPGAASAVSVRASRPLGEAEVRAAVEEAGYILVPA